MDAELAIEATGLRLRHGATQALDGLDLSVRAGTVLGLLGPNGAGKTTTVRVLSTLLTPDAGTVRVAGYDVLRRPAEVRRRIGLAGQYAAVDELLTGRQNLELIGVLLHLGRRAARRRAAELLDRYELTAAADKLVGGYSGGMRRRLDLASCLVVRPDVLFLDEPTTGLDPASRILLWGAVRDLVADGMTVLLTTQYLEEADQLADLIVVIDHGRVIAEGTADELKSKAGAPGCTSRSSTGRGCPLPSRRSPPSRSAPRVATRSAERPPCRSSTAWRASQWPPRHCGTPGSRSASSACGVRRWTMYSST